MRRLNSVLLIGCIIFPCFISGCIDGNINDARTLYVSIQGTKQYNSIQEAINASPENYTIYVYAGTYYENVVINKSIVLKGEDKLTTIIDGNNTDDVIFIDEGGHANISGFTIQNSGQNDFTTSDAGIEIMSHNNSIFNNIIRNNTVGIYTSIAKYNLFKQNIFETNKKYGMYLYSSSDYAIIEENRFLQNDCGLRIKGSAHANVTRNIFLNNDEGMYFCCGARLNTVYHNTFINNTLWNADDQVGGNNWDDGYPSGGNYWDDYSGFDEYQGSDQDIAGKDGIGDIAYNITSAGDISDHYPLMVPIAT
jgi:parallel beta-helix repeat protein